MQNAKEREKIVRINFRTTIRAQICAKSYLLSLTYLCVLVYFALCICVCVLFVWLTELLFILTKKLIQ